ncbi:hypothetical protein [Streptomyces microflavus]|uniref:hypothetical protein n=1 Tax=Streptomyces microflavus TaxID=1919 RepID=UPI0033FDEAFD
MLLFLEGFLLGLVALCLVSLDGGAVFCVGVCGALAGVEGGLPGLFGCLEGAGCVSLGGTVAGFGGYSRVRCPAGARGSFGFSLPGSLRRGGCVARRFVGPIGGLFGSVGVVGCLVGVFGGLLGVACGEVRVALGLLSGFARVVRGLIGAGSRLTGDRDDALDLLDVRGVELVAPGGFVPA